MCKLVQEDTRRYIGIICQRSELQQDCQELRAKDMISPAINGCKPHDLQCYRTLQCTPRVPIAIMKEEESSPSTLNPLKNTIYQADSGTLSDVRPTRRPDSEEHVAQSKTIYQQSQRWDVVTGHTKSKPILGLTAQNYGRHEKSWQYGSER